MTAVAKKFGTFGGVFTPSILTILGVIMYLRLPTIVGQGGLWMTLGIIAVAHVISVTTGLSVASIATDKRVRAGGSYYMISRSLGLPIGGTLGLALFVGMSFSISLYLIGFSESFLSYWGMPVDKNSIRVAGSIALGVVAIVTLISTALAMKTQYVIMLAIVASLATVVIGGFMQAAPAQAHFVPAAGSAAVGFGVLFGIFFPAVTGFEAGVSMSGDLKDPKKAIPLGTIAAIVVGFLVYVGLAFFLAFRIDPKALATDSDILSKVSVFAPILMAGVWGATVSSALGSILGAPRILQAASADGITHATFARGYGPTSEPRNALVLTVIIAEAGILIGELDVIARIVTMFFITAYGFLNMACAVESWASPDFRPDFKIPKSVSLLGALTCVVIMIQLDILAMIGASAVMSLLFVYLKRRELILEGGDTYEGIWSTIVRRGLYNLSRSTVHQRNWRPNMLLFSGGEDERPGLVAIARDLAQGRGMISNFDLEETSRARLRPKREEAVPPDSPDAEGIFTRVLQCRNVYESMEQIARYHGFSGIEPNTVLMGRAHNPQRAEKFAHLIQGFSELDYNTLLYDEGPRRTGPPNTIDVWWSGYGNNLSFSLALVRFLHSTARWQHAKLRFLIIADDAGLAERYRGRLAATIESMRVRGEILVIFNGVEQRNFADIIGRESKESDLVLLGIPDFSREPPQRALERMNELTESLREILWVRASSFFPTVAVERPAIPTGPRDAGAVIPPLDFATAEPLRSFLTGFAPKLSEVVARFYSRKLAAPLERRLAAIERLDQLTARCYDGIQEALASGSTARRSLSHFYGSFLHLARTHLSPEGEETDDPEASDNAAQELDRELAALVSETPEQLSVLRPASFFRSARSSPWTSQARSAVRRGWARLLGGEMRATIPCRAILAYRLHLRLPGRLAAVVRHVGKGQYDFIAATHRIVARVDASLRVLESMRRSGQLTDEAVRTDRARVKESIREELAAAQAAIDAAERITAGDSRRLLLRAAADMDHPNANQRSRLRKLPRKARDREIAGLSAAVDTLHRNGYVLREMQTADLRLFFIRNRIRGVVERTLGDAAAAIRGSLVGRLRRAADAAASGGKNQATISERPFNAEEFSTLMMGHIRPVLAELPEAQDILTAESVELYEKSEFHQAVTINVAIRRYIESVTESDLSAAVRKFADSLQRSAREAQSVLADAIASPGGATSEETGHSSTGSEGKLPSGKLSAAADRLEAAIETFETEVLAALEKVGDRLSAFFFVHRPDSIELFVRASERRFLRARIAQLVHSTKQFFAQALGRLLLGRSRAAVLAQRREADEPEWNRVSLLQDLREALSPAPGAVALLPRYYRFLFLEKASPSREFWVGRRTELEEFSRATVRARSGLGGTIIVTGPPESGKTWFSRFAAERHFANTQILEVFLKDASASPQAFQDALSRATANSPDGSAGGNRCIIVNDLELLWERRLDGYSGLHAVLEQVRSAEPQTLFVLNLNLDAFLLLRQTFPLDSLAARVIELGPFMAEELRDLVMRKHEVSGYGLQLQGTREGAISLLQQARFFDAIFAESGGLPGPALRAYARLIESVQDNIVRIKHPTAISDLVLRELPPSWKFILATLVLHKRIRDERLLPLCEPIDPQAETILAALRHARILMRTGADGWRLDPAVLPPLRRILREEGVL